MINICIAFEDAFVIFFLDYFADHNAFIHLRNISEDIRNLTLCFSVLFYYYHMLKLTSPQTLENIELDQDEKITLIVEYYNLTKRETEIINLLLEEKSNKQIAEELFITLATLKTHIHHIYQKCNVTSRLQLVQVIQKIHHEEDIQYLNIEKEEL